MRSFFFCPSYHDISIFSCFFFSYHRALLDQPQQAILPAEYATVVPAVLFVLGQIFVVTSTWALGITGTFLGDYFGILMDSRVEGYVARFIREGESFG